MVGLGESDLRHTPSDIDNAMLLYTFLKEPTGLLVSLCQGLQRAFMDAGLRREDSLRRSRGGREFLQKKVINTQGLSSGFLKSKPSLKHAKVDLVPRFNARGICEKYKDVVWAKGVHLDRVCISEVSSVEDIMEDGQCVGARFQDIASVPLPGVTWEPRPFEYLRIPRR